jgi:hypothetical protein
MLEEPFVSVLPVTPAIAERYGPVFAELRCKVLRGSEVARLARVREGRGVLPRAFFPVLVAAIASLSACEPNAFEELCNSVFQLGRAYAVRVVERHADNVEPQAPPEFSCGDALDFAVGDTFVVRADEPTEYGPYGCNDRWGFVTGLPNVRFGDRLDATGALTFRLNFSVTIGQTCTGEWKTAINASRGHEFDRVALAVDGGGQAHAGQPAVVGLVREFVPTSSPGSCGLTHGRCIDKYAVEITPR